SRSPRCSGRVWSRDSIVFSPNGTASRINCGSSSVPKTSGPLVSELATFLTAIFLIEQEVADATIRASPSRPKADRAAELVGRRVGEWGTRGGTLQARSRAGQGAARPHGARFNAMS